MKTAAPSIGIVTVGEASRIAEVSPATIREWTRTGRLSLVHRTSSGWRMYRREDVERIVAERGRVLQEKLARFAEALG